MYVETESIEFLNALEEFLLELGIDIDRLGGINELHAQFEEIIEDYS